MKNISGRGSAKRQNVLPESWRLSSVTESYQSVRMENPLGKSFIVLHPMWYTFCDKPHNFELVDTVLESMGAEYPLQFSVMQ